MAQRLAEQAMERQIMKLRRQGIPTPPLMRVPHRANRHLTRYDPVVGSLMSPWTPSIPQRLLNSHSQTRFHRRFGFSASTNTLSRLLNGPATYVERKKATGLTADIDAVSPSISSVRRGPGWCACHVYGVSGQWSEIRLLEPISKQALTHDLVSETSASCQCLAPPRDRTRCLDLELAPPKRAVRCRGSCQAVRPSDPKALYEGPRSLALSIQRLVHSMTYISIA